MSFGSFGLTPMYFLAKEAALRITVTDLGKRSSAMMTLHEVIIDSATLLARILSSSQMAVPVLYCKGEAVSDCQCCRLSGYLLVCILLGRYFSEAPPEIGLMEQELHSPYQHHSEFHHAHFHHL